MIALLQCGSTQSRPHVFTINRTGHLDRDRQVAALNGQIESGLRILYEVQRDLRVSLLLQIPNDTLADKIGVANDLQHLIVVLPDECKLETVFSRINGNGARFCGPIETVDDLPFDSSQVYGLIKGFDNTVVTACQLGSR